MIDKETDEYKKQRIDTPIVVPLNTEYSETMGMDKGQTSFVANTSTDMD